MFVGRLTKKSIYWLKLSVRPYITWRLEYKFGWKCCIKSIEIHVWFCFWLFNEWNSQYKWVCFTVYISSKVIWNNRRFASATVEYPVDLAVWFNHIIIGGIEHFHKTSLLEIRWIINGWKTMNRIASRHTQFHLSGFNQLILQRFETIVIFKY